MKIFKVKKYSTTWSTSGLTEKGEVELAKFTKEGWDIVSVAFGVNLWWMPTAFITISKLNND